VSIWHLEDVLSGRAGLEGVQWLLVAEGQRRVLPKQVKAMLSPGARLGGCLLRRARFRPGRKVKAFYDVMIKSRGSQYYSARPVAVTWESNRATNEQRKDADTVAIEAEARSRDVASPFRELAANLPQSRMRVLVWPVDPEFPQLVRLSDRQYVHNMLIAAHTASAPGEYIITPVRYRPGQRHVLRYGRADARRVGPLFAKLYPGQDSADVFQRSAQISEWLRNQAKGVYAVQPLANFLEDGVVLYPGLSGIPLPHHVPIGHDTVAGWIERAGAALAVLHEMPKSIAGPLQTHDFAAEANAVARASAYIRMLISSTGQAIEDVLIRARDLHEHLPAEELTVAHGDFKSEHVWLTLQGMTLIDFDSSCLAEPALDVGKFLAHLHLWHSLHEQPGLEVAQESFLAGYAPRDCQMLRARARLYEALELIKITARRVPVFDPQWAMLVERLVSHAQAVLNDLELATRSSITKSHKRDLYGHAACRQFAEREHGSNEKDKD
jgi:Phosphotransferase enzyme family